MAPDRVGCLSGVLVVLLGSAGGQAAILDPAFTETVLTSPELLAATGMVWAPDGSNRLFVSIKNGTVRVVKNGAVLPAPFATVSPVYTMSECGIIGIAVDPNFLVNKYVYVFATVSASEQQIIRFTANGDVGENPTPILTKLPTNGANHDGGAVGFGFDGKLYWAIGDLGAAVGVNDDLASLAAKIGRANLDGTPVADNPFVDGAGPNNEYIWARGFRNPYTFIFQPSTGALWVNDVGAAFEQVFIMPAGGHAGWTLYENTQPPPFITPVVKYRTNGSADPRMLLPVEMSGAVRAAGTVTFSLTLGPHYFRVGEPITSLNVTDASFNGEFFIKKITSPTSFTVTQAGADAISGGGLVETMPIGANGAAVSGGAFWDSTGVPAAYRGNFFFGDFVSGRTERVTLDASDNSVTTVKHWAMGVGGQVDSALGPDGDMYFLNYSTGTLTRASWKATAQGIVVSPANLWLVEGQPAVANVRLAMDPGQSTTVSVATTGDPEIVVRSGAPLTFTSANWNVPQTVTLAAAWDLDAVEDKAMVSFTAGAVTETIAARARDDNSLALRASAGSLTLAEGKSEVVKVSLSSAPSLDVVVSATRWVGDEDITVTAAPPLTFTPVNWQAPQDLIISSRNDADGIDDRASIEIAAPGLAPLAVNVIAKDDEPAPDGGMAGGDAGAQAGDGPDAGARDAAGGDAGGKSGGGDGCGCRIGAGGGVETPPALLAIGLLFGLGVLLTRRRARSR